MRVAISLQYSPLHHRVKDFDDRQPQILEVYGEIASRYKPDVFVVVHERTTMVARL